MCESGISTSSRIIIKSPYQDAPWPRRLQLQCRARRLRSKASATERRADAGDPVADAPKLWRRSVERVVKEEQRRLASRAVALATRLAWHLDRGSKSRQGLLIEKRMPEVLKVIKWAAVFILSSALLAGEARPMGKTTPKMAPEEIALIPFGDVEGKLLKELKGDFKKITGKSIRILPSEPIPRPAYNPRRRQYLASEFIKTLQKLPLLMSQERLGLTEVDLYAEGLNFVFGQAELGGRCALISVVRLRSEFYGKRPDEKLLRLRTLKEAVHEMGHIWRLEHCSKRTCVMHFSNSLRDTDRKNPHFCNDCLKRLKVNRR